MAAPCGAAIPLGWANLQTQHDLEVTRQLIHHERAAITPHTGNRDTQLLPALPAMLHPTSRVISAPGLWPVMNLGCEPRNRQWPANLGRGPRLFRQHNPQGAAHPKPSQRAPQPRKDPGSTRKEDLPRLGRDLGQHRREPSLQAPEIHAHCAPAAPGGPPACRNA